MDLFSDIYFKIYMKLRYDNIEILRDKRRISKSYRKPHTWFREKNYKQN